MLNVYWYLVIATVSLTHMAFLVPYVPDGLAIPLNIVAIPILIGCAGYLLFRGPLTLTLALVATLPIVHVLVFGGDPGKPGLEYYVALAEGAVMLLAVLACFSFSKLATRRAASP